MTQTTKFYLFTTARAAAMAFSAFNAGVNAAANPDGVPMWTVASCFWLFFLLTGIWSHCRTRVERKDK